MIFETVATICVLTPMLAAAAEPDGYLKRDTWQETLDAALAAPQQDAASRDLRLSDWSWVGPFSISGNSELAKVFATPFAPEAEPLDVAKPLEGGKLRWAAQPKWKDGEINRLGTAEFAAYYITRTINAPTARHLTLYLGSDDAITVWLNGKKVHSHMVGHWCAPDQEVVGLDLKAGENRLTIKITNGVLDAAFYFALRPRGADGSDLSPLWEQLVRDFPAAAQQIAWVREDGIFSKTPARIYRYDDPQLTLRGQWRYHHQRSLAISRRSDQAGDEATVDFVGDTITLLQPGGLVNQHPGLFSRESEQRYGLAAVTLDGQPVIPGGSITRDAEGRSEIDTSRDARLVVAHGLIPGRHRLTVTNLGRPSHPGGSTAVAVIGFSAGVEGRGTPCSIRAWRYALAVRGGKAWQEQAAKLAAQANDAAGLKAMEQLYFASREVEVLAARLRTVRDRPPPSTMVEREANSWRPQAETLAYFRRLAELKSQAAAALAQSDNFVFDSRQPAAFSKLLDGLRRVGEDIDALFAAQSRQLPPIIFFTGAPLASNAVPNYVWNGNPIAGRWGCSIRIWDPAHPENPAKVIFEDPKSIIFDLNLAYDAKTIFVSMRRDGQQYWQIYEMGIDGRNLKQISDGDFYNVCPVPLPDGRLAYLSSRTPGSHTVCQSGPSMHVHVMNRDGSEAKDLSANTLTDFGLSILDDGRLIFTRWEYVDADLGCRQSLWTMYPDGRQFQLYGGNTRTDPATFWQAREIPGRDAVVCTFAPHHGSPYGAIGLVSRRFGIEAPRDQGFRWITEEFPVIEDLNHFWAYRDPCPVGESQFLVSYGGGGLQRFRIFLLDELDNKSLVYEDPATSCFYPQPVRPRLVPKHIPDLAALDVKYLDVPAAPPGQPESQRVPLGRFLLTDVYRGLEPDVARGRVKSIRIMEQLPKTVNTTWYRVYDQGPLMSGGTTYYAKRCWGYAPVEEDGSAYFEAPAGKELYFQACDAEGRELQRMTSGAQIMPGEVQSCVGCHESRDSAQPNRSQVLALGREASPLELPEWGNAGVIDYARIVQPILDRHCARCHEGPAPKGGVLLTGGHTRFFNMSYDNLIVRSQSAQVSTDRYLGLGDGLPLVQFNNMFPGIYAAHRPLTTGSLASRLPRYFEKDHCETEVPASEKRRVYEWIDAMAPYYTTYYSARPGSRGDRDRWGDNRQEKKIADWYVQGFAPAYQRRCQSCHGPIHLDATYEWGGKWAWIDLSRPEWSPALTAHLAKEAGGRGITEKDFGKLLDPRWTERRSVLLGRWASLQNDYRVMRAALESGQTVAMFRNDQDPDYQSMLQAIRQGARYMAELPEADMPGFVNRSAHASFGGR